MYTLYVGKGYKSTAIVRELEEEGVRVSVSGVCRLIKKYKTTGSIARLPGSGRPPKITREVLVLVERQMTLDDETTATQLEKLLRDKGYPLCLQTILNAREKLGWTYRGSSYCQVIRHPNKVRPFTCTVYCANHFHLYLIYSCTLFR